MEHYSLPVAEIQLQQTVIKKNMLQKQIINGLALTQMAATFRLNYSFGPYSFTEFPIWPL